MANTLAYNKMIEVDATVKVPSTLYRIRKDYSWETYDTAKLCVMRTPKESTEILHSPHTGARLGYVYEGGLELADRVFDSKKDALEGLTNNPPVFGVNTTDRTKQKKLMNHAESMKIAKAGFISILGGVGNGKRF